MAGMTTLQKTGLAILVASLAVGTTGSAWSVYSSFTALEAAENAGIGAVGDQIRNALLFGLGGLVGSAIGIMLLLVGRANSDRI